MEKSIVGEFLVFRFSIFALINMRITTPHDENRHARAKEGFLAACAMAPEDRVAFLDSLCGSDRELRREIESLLAHHQPEPFRAAALSSPAIPPALTPSSPTPSSFPVQSRFQPGQLVAGRYRIVSLIGRGGMGEVYRAEDLTLSQTVALKFLPEGLAGNLSWLMRLRQEVRIARQVTHPNVCRVYDIAEFDGETFISMEYVDGEDLASLLRRIGRLPTAKASQIGRQLCSGLAAAHSRGVIHRDLKPANILIDGEGQVRITDFGIALLSEDLGRMGVSAGTPGYMAPEQSAGRPTTVQSDLFSLGVVLYEACTGHRPFSRELNADPGRPPKPPQPVSDTVPAVAPREDAMILRCLRPDPAGRPASAQEVYLAFASTDPLAAVLEAGHTPSPEMVAASGGAFSWSARTSAVVFACFLAGLALAAVLATLLARAEGAVWQTPPEALAEKARSLLRQLGYAEAGDVSFGFTTADTQPGQAPVVQFWYRESPEELVPFDIVNLFFGEARVSLEDPPLLEEGMVRVVLNPDGSLYSLEAVPLSGPPDPQDTELEGLETKGVGLQDAGARGAAEPAAADWPLLFKAAGLSLAQFHATTPSWNPPFFADERLAWELEPASPPAPVSKVHAAAFQGQPVYFRTDGGEAEAPLPAQQAEARLDWAIWLNNAKFLLLLLAGIPLAWKNLRERRADQQGALRLSGFIFLVRLAAYLLRASHTRDFDQELDLLSVAVGAALFESALAWVFYMAIEPQVRRLWPQTLVSWSRVLSGRFRDPLPGRDLLVGSLAGVIWAILGHLDRLIPYWIGLTPFAEMVEALLMLPTLGARNSLAALLDALLFSIYEGLTLLLLFFLLRVLLRNAWAAAVVFVAITALFSLLEGSHLAVSWLTWGLAGSILGAWLLVRFGLLALVVGSFVSAIFLWYPLTLDPGVWYAETSLFALLAIVSVAGYGLLASQASQWSQWSKSS